jgi:hypothetical protein
MKKPSRKNFPKILRPHYRLRGVNDSITLYDGAFDIEHGGHPHLSRGTLRFEWQPSPTVRFTYTSDRRLHGLADEVALELPAGRLLHGRITSEHFSSDSKASQGSGFVVDDQEQNKNVTLDRVTFHVANFVDYLGSTVLGWNHGSRCWTRRVAGRWVDHHSG